MNGKAHRPVKKGGKVPKTPEYAQAPWPRKPDWTKPDAYELKPGRELTAEEFHAAMAELRRQARDE